MSFTSGIGYRSGAHNPTPIPTTMSATAKNVRTKDPRERFVRKDSPNRYSATAIDASMPRKSAACSSHAALTSSSASRRANIRAGVATVRSTKNPSGYDASRYGPCARPIAAWNAGSVASSLYGFAAASRSTTAFHRSASRSQNALSRERSALLTPSASSCVAAADRRLASRSFVMPVIAEYAVA